MIKMKEFWMLTEDDLKHRIRSLYTATILLGCSLMIFVSLFIYTWVFTLMIVEPVLVLMLILINSIMFAVSIIVKAVMLCTLYLEREKYE